MTKKPSILIVDDDAWLAEQYVRMIEKEGFFADHAPHALAAMDILEKGIPNVIVLDVLLSGPNAFTLLHELRSHTDLAAIPIIFCTNSAADLHLEDLKVYGVVQLLDKTTMHPDDLLIAIKKVLR